MAEHDSENHIEETDEEKRYRLYDKSVDQDSNLISLNNSDFNKAIRYIAATLLVVLFSGVSFQDSNPTFFNWIFILSVSTIISNLLAYPFSLHSLKQHIMYAERYFLARDHTYRFKQHWTNGISIFFEYLSVFLLGVVAFLLVFGFLTNRIIIKGVL